MNKKRDPQSGKRRKVVKSFLFNPERYDAKSKHTMGIDKVCTGSSVLKWQSFRKMPGYRYTAPENKRDEIA